MTLARLVPRLVGRFGMLRFPAKRLLISKALEDVAFAKFLSTAIHQMYGHGFRRRDAQSRAALLGITFLCAKRQVWRQWWRAYQESS
jgi:hypothetical protein